ncbi:MAG: DHA2 family efflux MFS transporter permease subunit [Gemmatimonadota bacterium]
MATGGNVRLDSAAGRWVLAATVLGSAVAMLTGTVVNVALPALGTALQAGTEELQWILNGYLLALASLILIGGSLGDRYGHRRMFVVGTAWFAVASILCALAPDVRWLIGFRVLQGIGAALLLPESLAIIEAVFHPDDRGRAIGAWSALGGIAAAVGPLLGGWLIDLTGWRSVFLLVLPLTAVVIAVGLARIPRTPTRDGESLDVAGASTAFLALGLLTYALVRGSGEGFGQPLVIAAGLIGFAALLAFLAIEARVEHPMVPLTMFADRLFAAGNAVTFVVYAALGGSFFLLVVYLQVGLGYSALAAGASLLPITALMLALSARAGQYAQDHGSRVPLTLGPLLAAAGLALMATIDPGESYWVSTFPAVAVFGLGLATTVAPVTSTVLGAAPEGREGAASGINNAVSRTAQLAAVAIFPAVAGLAGGSMGDRDAMLAGFPRAALAMAAVAALGGLLGWTLIRPQPGALEARPDAGVGRACRHCALDGTPLAVRGDGGADGRAA